MHNKPDSMRNSLKFYLRQTRVVFDTILRAKMMRLYGSSAKQKVTQYYVPDFGESFNLRQFLWGGGEQQPYLRQLQ